MDEYRKPAVEGLLGMCSLLGGVYASSMLLESALQVRPSPTSPSAHALLAVLISLGDRRQEWNTGELSDQCSLAGASSPCREAHPREEDAINLAHKQ